MDFKKVLNILLDFFRQNDIRFAVIGAFGLSAYGLPRMTQDLDFAVEKASQAKIVSFLESQNYETLYLSTGYSNHLHPDRDMGRLDFVYLDKETAETIFSDTQEKPFGQSVSLPVPRPEHIAAMKIFAMKNDPSREYREMADVQFLLSLPDVDRDEIKRYFEYYGLPDKYEEIEKNLEAS